MVAVSDTSAISNLAIIGRLHLLQSQFEAVWIPEAVRTELEPIPNSEAEALIDQAFRTGWLKCRPLQNPGVAAVLSKDLDKGEAEAIALAIEIQADVLLIDEKQGRSFARRTGIPVRGVLGVLIRAKAMGELPCIKNELQALRDRAGFFVAPSLESEVLRTVGEE